MESIIDYRGKTPEKTTAGIPLITAKVIKGGRIETPSEFIAADAFEEWMRRGIPQAGDVVITTEAPLGEVAQLPKGKVALAQRVITLSGKKGLVDNTFLKYLLLSRPFQEDLEARATGTTVVGIKQSVLRKIDLAFPSFLDQKAIAHILGTLDDKIELNRKTNETLEAMAKALFKSWFVDFDPVRAKAEGRPTGLPAEISDLFPDSFEDSELGEIPSGWQCSPLADRAIYLSRGISPAYCEEGGVLVLNQKCVRDSRISFEKARRHDTTRKQIIGREVRRFDALVNSTGVGTLGRVAMMPICQEEVVVDSHVTVVRGSNEQESFFISSTLLNRQTEIEALGEGSTGQTELSRVVLGSVPVIFPSPQLISAYFDFAFIIQDKIEKNDQISVALASARDALLPKLISGEIRIPDAEKMLEEVGV
jgi:type I restriction enzyme S subunit